MESTTCSLAVRVESDSVVVATEGVLDGEAARALIDLVLQSVQFLERPVHIDLGPIEGWTDDGISGLAKCHRLVLGERRLAYRCATPRARAALQAAEAHTPGSPMRQASAHGEDPLRRR